MRLLSTIVKISKHMMKRGVATDCLTNDLLRKLIVEESVDYLIVPKYCSSALCDKVNTQLLNEKIERYDHDIYDQQTNRLKKVYAGVDRVGTPFNNVFSCPDPQKRQKLSADYYANARVFMRWLRDACAESMSPIDRLRLDLEDAYRDGARVARFQGLQMFCGIARITQAERSAGGEQPHFDMLPEDVYPLDKQFAANIYLKVPQEGGVIKMWGEKTFSRDRITSLSFHDDVTEGEEPRCELSPSVGDLVLFNTRKPHAVTRFNEGYRVSLQCFIGYKQGEPLQLWN